MRDAPTRMGETRTEVGKLLLRALFSHFPDQNGDYQVQEQIAPRAFWVVTAGKKQKAAKQGQRLGSMKRSGVVEPVNTAAALSSKMKCGSHQYTCSSPATIRSISTEMMKRSSKFNSCTSAAASQRWLIGASDVSTSSRRRRRRRRQKKKKRGSAELFRAENAFRFNRNAKFASAVWDQPDGFQSAAHAFQLIIVKWLF